MQIGNKATSMMDTISIQVVLVKLVLPTLLLLVTPLSSVPVVNHSEAHKQVDLVRALNVSVGTEQQIPRHTPRQRADKRPLHFTPENSFSEDGRTLVNPFDQRENMDVPNLSDSFISEEYVSHRERDESPNHKFRKVQEKSDTLIKRLCQVTGRTTVCYQHGRERCLCQGGLADCSGKRFVPNLPYAPSLPPQVKCLRFTYNNVRHFSDSYFTNVSNFLVIDFSSNKLQTISDKTFQVFSNLKYLMLNYNDVSYKYLKRVLNYPPQLRLDIVGLQLRELPKDYFHQFRDIPTSEIYMDFNFMPNLDLSEFSVLQHLKYLSLTNLSIQNLTTARLPALKVLDLDYNKIKSFPTTCGTSVDRYESFINSGNSSKRSMDSIIIDTLIKGNSRSRETPLVDTPLFPNLEELYIGVNEISFLPQEICLPRLVTLHLERNRISELRENAFKSLHSLKLLILDRMETRISKIGPSAFGIPSLTSLFLSKANINFASDEVSTKMFKGSRWLVDLYIDHNNLRGVSDSDLWTLFYHAPNIKYLWMGSTSITHIPTKAFALLKDLRNLYIYINDIEEIPPGAFDVMTSLERLYMDQNRISTIRPNTFSPGTRSRLKDINLSKNNFLCDCDLRWFKSWLNESGPKVFLDYQYYTCSNIPNVAVQNYTLSQQACLLSQTTYILFVICLSILMVTFIVFALVFRYRWHIRLALYARRTARQENAAAANTQNNRFDLFIIYCNDDNEWVQCDLLRKVEEWGLRVCIHGRDFKAGGTIIDNIIESMQNSTRILVVISSRFAHSKWCTQELLLCQSHMVDHDLPSLFVIKLDHIEARDMSGAMFALYNTTCCLELPAEEEEMPTFWRRLRKNLKPLINARAQTSVLRPV